MTINLYEVLVKTDEGFEGFSTIYVAEKDEDAAIQIAETLEFEALGAKQIAEDQVIYIIEENKDDETMDWTFEKVDNPLRTMSVAELLESIVSDYSDLY